MKTASVYARIDEDLKTQAEAVFARLGIPVSVAINMFYSQVAMRQAIPFPLSAVPAPAALEDLTTEQLDRKLDAAYQSAQNGEGRPASTVFHDLEKEFGF